MNHNQIQNKVADSHPDPWRLTSCRKNAIRQILNWKVRFFRNFDPGLHQTGALIA